MLPFFLLINGLEKRTEAPSSVSMSVPTLIRAQSLISIETPFVSFFLQQQ